MPNGAESPVRARVSLIEDNPDIGEGIRAELETDGYSVRWMATFEDGLKAARSGGAELLIVDRVLGDEDGLVIIETLRDEGNFAPILIISGLSTVDDRIRGLRAGDDDYLVKPFSLHELSVRIETSLRRARYARETLLRAGPIEMDLVERKVRRNGEPVDLLAREFKLLEYFMRRPGQIITRAMLLEDVWKYKFLPQTNVVDVHIGNLRRKLDAGGDRHSIVNARAMGFKLDVED